MCDYDKIIALKNRSEKSFSKKSKWLLMLIAGLLLIKNELAKAEYDWLIQLCDSLAGAEGVPDIEERMGNVKKRYGSYPQDKWNSNIP